MGPSGVTTSGATMGVPIEPGDFVNLPFTHFASVFLIAATSGNDVVVQELA